MTIIRTRRGSAKSRHGDTSREMTTLVRLPWRKASPRNKKPGGRASQSAAAFAARSALPLSERHQAVLDVLPAAQRDVVQALGITRGQAGSALNALGIRGLAVNDHGTWRRA